MANNKARTSPARPVTAEPKPRNRLESEILQEVLRDVGSRADVRVWRQNTGAARTKSGAVVRFGLPGQADITGIAYIGDGYGIRLEIEVKSATGRPSPEQLHWGALIETFGGIYIIARSGEDAVRQLDRALEIRGGGPDDPGESLKGPDLSVLSRTPMH